MSKATHRPFGPLIAALAISSTLLTGCSTQAGEIGIAPPDPAFPILSIDNSEEEAEDEAAEGSDKLIETDPTNKPAANQPSNSSKPSGNNSGSSGNSGSSAQAHTHSWVYHEAQYDSIWHNAVTKEISVCNTCGADITGNTAAHAKEHVMKGENGGHSGKTVVITPAYEEQVLVKKAYYSCSCGATK